MISDTLNHAEVYEAVHPLFKQSFDFLKGLDPETENGAYEIAPGLVAHVSEYTTSPAFQYGWETHRKYIDIQFCLSGKERIEWTPLSDALKPSIDYDDEKDRTFYQGKGQQTFIAMGKDVFVVFFPHDAHAPQINYKDAKVVKKVIIKVPV